MNYNGYPQNMNGMYNSYPYPQMPNQNMMPKYEVIKVKGKPGVDAFHMGPNSSVLLLDETANIVWYVETDGAGYKTATPFDVTPHVEVSNIRSGVKTGLTKWFEWESGTLKVLKEVYIDVCEEDVTFGVLLQALIYDVECEIKTINKNILKDKATDYDVILMMSEQGELIKKYNKKIKHDIDFTKMGV